MSDDAFLSVETVQGIVFQSHSVELRQGIDEKGQPKLQVMVELNDNSPAAITTACQKLLPGNRIRLVVAPVVDGL